jgi:acetate kinase
MSPRDADDRRVLTVNAGSTSLKIDLVEDGRSVAQFAALDEALTAVGPVETVAHRIVHGGDRTAAVVVDDAVVHELRELVELAPLHQPPALDVLAQSRAALPRAVHVACFDTTFHTTISPAAATYALPARLRRLVRVYGFHGLAHEWASRCVAELEPAARRVVVAHLGGGQSLCAVLDGRSIATTMGFTPLDGLVMATRPGRVDPGAVLWLAEHSDEALDHVFEHESGLVGLCGTDDFRTMLERAERGDHDAELARDVVRFRLVTELGAMIAALGGVDVIAFSGGIGEHSSWVHTTVAASFSWLGSRVRTIVVGPGETVMMAEHALRARSSVDAEAT